MKGKTRLKQKWKFISLIFINVILLTFQNCGQPFKSTRFINGSSFSPSSPAPESTLNEQILDGQTLYLNNCASCHGTLSNSKIKNVTVNQINGAIQSISGMKELTKLSLSEISSIALALSQTGNSPFVSQFQCDATLKDAADTIPLKRLSSLQYLNTLQTIYGKNYDSSGHSLFKDASDLIATYPQDAFSKVGTIVFDSNYNDSIMKAQFGIADFISSQASSSSAKAVSLGLTSTCYNSPTTACIKSFITTFGRMMMRRKLSSTEIDQFYNIYYLSGSTNAEKLKALILGLEMDPEHLMPFSIGNDTITNGEVQLTPYEIATRLSYAILNDTPDDALLTAAESSSFLTDIGLQTQIDRLIQSPKFIDNINLFIQYWLQVNPKSGYPSDLPDIYFNDPILSDVSKKLQNVAELKKDAADFFVGILNQNMNYKDLMSAAIAFPTTATAAKVYGLNPTSTNGTLQNVNHHGLLQRPGFLMVANGNSNPIYRGKFILTQVLCKTIGSPADFSAVAAQPDLDPVFNSTRKVIEAKTSAQTCISCHSQFNHFGFALEAFDGLGRFRSTENYFIKNSLFNYRTSCNPSNTSITGYNDPKSDQYCPNTLPPYNHQLDLTVTPTFDTNLGPLLINNVSDFANTLAESPTVSSCLAVNLYRYTNLKMESTENNCELNEIQTKSHNSSQTLKNVLFDRFKQARFKTRKYVP